MPDTDVPPPLPTERLLTSGGMLRQSSALVAVTDTNGLASRACNAVRNGRSEDPLFAMLSATGRSNTFMGAHVPGELADHLEDVAANTGVGLTEAELVLWGQIMPHVPVVPVRPGDCMSPRARRVLRDDPALPASVRGDPDDVQTVAVAELLAPSVILSADSVFTRQGLANTTAVTWIEMAHNLLKAAGVEASFADAAMVVELAGRLLFAGAGAVLRWAFEHPLPALSVLAAGVILAGRLGYLDAARFRSGLRYAWETARPLVGMIEDQAEEWQQAQGALFVVEPEGPATVEQLAARYLARCGRTLTPSELRDVLSTTGHKLTAVGLKRAMTAHPAFTRLPGDRYTVGQVAMRELAVEQGR